MSMTRAASIPTTRPSRAEVFPLAARMKTIIAMRATMNEINPNPKTLWIGNFGLFRMIVLSILPSLTLKASYVCIISWLYISWLYIRTYYAKYFQKRVEVGGLQ